MSNNIPAGNQSYIYYTWLGLTESLHSCFPHQYLTLSAQPSLPYPTPQLHSVGDICFSLQIMSPHHGSAACIMHHASDFVAFTVCSRHSQFVLCSLVRTMGARTQSMQKQHNNGKMCTNWVFSLLSIFKGNISCNFLPFFPPRREKWICQMQRGGSFILRQRVRRVWALCSPFISGT